MEENKKLREHVLALESQKEGEPQFSTPNGEQKEAKTTTKEVVRPPKTEAEETRNFRSKEAETTKEAAGPQRSKNDGTASFTETSLEFMSLMMDSMTEMQKRMQEPRDDMGIVRGLETIRAGSPDLPPLAPWEAQQGPLILGDWLLLAEPIIADLSVLTAAEWWKDVVCAAEAWYRHHMSLSPLDRIKHPAEAPPALCLEKWKRVERRVASMILQSVPSQVRDELVASRRLSTCGVLTYLLVTCSPGGISQQQNLVRNLEDPPEIQNVLDGPIALRRWLRWRTRTKEIGAIAPDPALQLKGWLKMTKRTLESHRELQFRVSLVRSGLQVDTTPSEVNCNVEQFAYHLLAEFEQLALTEKRPGTRSDPQKPKPQEAEKPKVPKLKKLEEETKSPTRGFQRREAKMQVLLERARLPTWKSLQLVA